MDNPNAGIETVYMHITRQCNLACKYCYFDAGKPMDREMSLPQWVSFCQQMEACRITPRKIVFTGGEALMNPNLFNIAYKFAQAFRPKGIKLCLMSNGKIITKPIARRIAEIFDEIRISIDGPEEINDSLRGKGVYKQAVNALRLFEEKNILTSVTITVTQKNIRALKPFMSYLYDSVFVTSFHISPFRPVGRGEERSDLLYSWRRAQETVASFWESRFGATEQLKPKQAYTLPDGGRCGIGSHLNILPDGSIYPCHVLTEPQFFLGNVNTMLLADILSRSPVLSRLRALDFSVLCRSDAQLKDRAKEYICMGEFFKDFGEPQSNLI